MDPWPFWLENVDQALQGPKSPKYHTVGYVGFRKNCNSGFGWMPSIWVLEPLRRDHVSSQFCLATGFLLLSFERRFKGYPYKRGQYLGSLGRLWQPGEAFQLAFCALNTAAGWHILGTWTPKST